MCSKKLSPIFIWVSKFDVKLGMGVKIFKVTTGRWLFYFRVSQLPRTGINFENHTRTRQLVAPLGAPPSCRRQPPGWVLLARCHKPLVIFAPERITTVGGVYPLLIITVKPVLPAVVHKSSSFITYFFKKQVLHKYLCVGLEGILF